jgi:O-antigen ligase
MALVLTAALAAALASHLLPPRLFVASLVGLLGMAAVLHDYRLGVLALTLLLPWMYSPYMPHGRTLSLVNLFTVTTLAGWALSHWRVAGLAAGGGSPGAIAGAISGAIHGRTAQPPAHALQPFQQAPKHPLQRALWLGYALPIAWAGAMAYGHLGQAAANFPATAADFSALNFTIDRLLRPMVFPLYAFLLAQAIRGAAQPARFMGVALLGLSVAALLPALLAAALVWVRDADVTQRDSLMRPLGLHANEAGFLLAMAAVPLLAIALGRASIRHRLAAGLAFAGVALGLLATGTRGAVLALLVSAGVLVLRRRRITDVLWLAAAGTALALLLPDTLAERLMLGWADIDATSATNRADPLTQGRLSGWALLAPEVLSSPWGALMGHGLGSTAWMPATATGQFLYQHPHNLYLEILLDVGLLGLALMGWAFWKAQRALRQLSLGEGFDPRLNTPGAQGLRLSDNPVVRDYLSGAHAALFGLLAMAFTNLHYLPCPEQTALWFAVGWVWALWRPAPAPAPVRAPHPRASARSRVQARAAQSTALKPPAPTAQEAIRHQRAA